MHQFRMILQVYFAFQGSFAPRMRAYDRLPVRMMAKVLPIEVLFQVAVAVEGLQASLCRQSFTADAENTLSWFAFDRNRV